MSILIFPLITAQMATEPLLGQLIQTALALLAVCLLAYLVIRLGLMRLLGASKGEGRIRVIERLSLEPKRSLLLVEVEGRVFLLGITEGSMALLKELTPTKEEDVP